MARGLSGRLMERHVMFTSGFRWLMSLQARGRICREILWCFCVLTVSSCSGCRARTQLLVFFHTELAMSRSGTPSPRQTYPFFSSEVVHAGGPSFHHMERAHCHVFQSQDVTVMCRS